MDHSALTDSIEGFDPLTETQEMLAAKIVALHSKDAAECSETMQMLGIHPHQEKDVPRALVKLPAPLNERSKA